MSKTENTPATQKIAIGDIKIPDALFAGDGETNIWNSIDYTIDLMEALTLGLTTEESKMHTLSILIHTRLELLQEALRQVE